MLILCILSAEEASKARPLLAHSMQTLLETARTPLNDDWDQTLDLPQVCSYRGKMLVFVIKKRQNKKQQRWWNNCAFLLQVCAVHTLQALVRSTALGVAILQFAPDVAILSLTLLSSPCWAMRNAALQLYSETLAHLEF